MGWKQFDISLVDARLCTDVEMCREGERELRSVVDLF